MKLIGNRFARRKWGWYLTLLDRKHFKVKLLKFNMDGMLSWQYHKLRRELWLFLSGEGVFKCGTQKNAMRVAAGDCRFVALEEGHQYLPWVKTYILEIQFGERCIEEDIVRV